MISGCALWKNSLPPEFEQKYRAATPNDYLQHLESLKDDLLLSNKGKIKKISKKSRSYLEEIYKRITENSQSLLLGKDEPEFYVIESKTPFFFSLPGSSFFFSSNLLKTHVKNENLLVAMLTVEIIRSLRGVYLKRRIVPTGYLEVDTILSILRIPVESRLEVDKLAYFSIERAGYDSNGLLLWLQNLNKNNSYYALLYGSTNAIAKEESLFKSFLVGSGFIDKFSAELEKNSSREFYSFLREVERM